MALLSGRQPGNPSRKDLPRVRDKPGEVFDVGASIIKRIARTLFCCLGFFGHKRIRMNR